MSSDWKKIGGQADNIIATLFVGLAILVSSDYKKLGEQAISQYSNTACVVVHIYAQAIQRKTLTTDRKQEVCYDSSPM